MRLPDRHAYSVSYISIPWKALVMKPLHVDSGILGAHSISRPAFRRNRRQAASSHPEPRNSLPRSRGRAIAGICLVPYLPRCSRGLDSLARISNIMLLSAPRFWTNFLRLMSWWSEYQCTISQFQAISKLGSTGSLLRVIAFIGLPDVEVVRAEGVAKGPEPKAQAIDAAQRAIAKLKVA